jgi:hypothetical protein
MYNIKQPGTYCLGAPKGDAAKGRKEPYIAGAAGAAIKEPEVEGR